MSPRYRVIGLAGLILLRCVSVASGDVRVSLISMKGSAQKASKAVRCVHMSTLKMTGVILGMPVLAQDEFVCEAPQVEFELSDSTRAVRLRSPFDVIYLGTPENVLTLVVVNGEPVVSGSDPTRTGAGTVQLVSHGTVYSVKAPAKGDSPGPTCIVFEGEASCSTSTKVVPIPAGRRVHVIPGAPLAKSNLSEADVERTADLLSSCDFAKAKLAGEERSLQPGTRDSLRQLYAVVLRNPSDADAHAKLGVSQVAMNLNREGLYQLGRAEATAPAERQELHAVIAGARSEAFIQLGLPDRARATVEQAHQSYPAAKVPVSHPVTILKSGVIQFKDPSTVEDGQKHLYHLMETREFHDAGIGFDGRIQLGSKDARDYLGLARSQAKLGNTVAASVNASLALQRDFAAKTLSEDERAAAEKLSRKLNRKWIPRMDEIKATMP